MITIAPLLNEAEQYLTRRDLDRAAELYRRAFVLDQGHSALPMVGLARIAVAMGKIEQARLLIDRVLELHPSSVEALTLRATVAEAMNEHEVATTLLHRAICIRRDFAPAWANLGRLAAQAKRWTEARDALLEARAIEPSWAEITVLLGVAAFRCKDYRTAISCLSARIEMEPKDLEAVITLADILLELGKPELADNLLEAASAHDRQAVLLQRRVVIKLHQGDNHVALELARQVAETRKTDDNAWLLVSVLESMRLNLENAERSALQALQCNDQNWKVHAQLAAIYEALRLRSAALVAYRRAIQLAPEAWEPLNNLGAMLLEERAVESTQEALNLLTRAVEHAPAAERAMPYFNLALSQYKLGRVSDAKSTMTAVARSPRRTDLTVRARRFLGLGAGENKAA